ncbi:MAG: DbpA RNA binding domain-containing protein, partial [Methanoculleus sp.]
ERIISEDYTALEVAAALLKLELTAGSAEAPQEIRPAQGPVLLEIPFGRSDQIRPKDIVGALAGETGIPGGSIGAIEIYETHSTVEVPPDAVAQIIERMRGKTIAGIRLPGPIEIVGTSRNGRRI